MKIPVVYELNGRRHCLLVQDGETISVGRGEACTVRLASEGVQEVEMTAQFVNGCQFVVVHPTNGGVPYAQSLPWKIKAGGQEAEMLCPFRPEQGVAVKAGRELLVQGLAGGETRLVLPADAPLLLGSSPACAVVVPDTGCPEVLLALWPAAGGKVLVQVLDDSAVVGWLGRAGETEAELDLPLSLSIGGRVLLIRRGDAAAEVPAVLKPVVPAVTLSVPKVTSILAKSAEAYPKIVSRQAKAGEGEEEKSSPVRHVGPTGKVLVQGGVAARVPVPQPRPLGVEGEAALLAGPEVKAAKPYSPTVFLLFSWLLVLLMFAVALLPGQKVLTPEQLVQLWHVAGGTLVLTLVLGLGVMLK